MGGLFKSKSQTSSSTSKSEPWGPAQDSLKDILGEIGNWYDSASNQGYISSTGDLGSIYQDYLQGLSGISGQASQGTQDLLNQSSASTQAAAQGFNNLAGGGLNTSTADIASQAGTLVNNDLLQSQIDAVNRGIQQNLTEQAFTGIDRNAVGSGNAGSSRAGVAQAIAARDASQQMADNAASIRSTAYQNAINTAQNQANQNTSNIMAGITGQANIGTNLQNQASQYSSTLLNSLAPMLQSGQLNQTVTAADQADQIGQRDYIANLIQQYYLPTAATVGGLGGSSTSSQSTPGSSMFNSLLGAGAAAGQIYSAFSDARLKKNIQKVHTDADGLNWYKWDWKDEAKDIVGNQDTYGVLAHEVKQLFPDAVSVDDATGFMKVDYSKL